MSAENELGAAMGAFNIQVEAYPDLKASTNFMQLQNEISKGNLAGGTNVILRGSFRREFHDANF